MNDNYSMKATRSIAAAFAEAVQAVSELLNYRYVATISSWTDINATNFIREGDSTVRDVTVVFKINGHYQIEVLVRVDQIIDPRLQIWQASRVAMKVPGCSWVRAYSVDWKTGLKAGELMELGTFPFPDLVMPK